MRSRTALFTALLAVGLFAVPHFAQASIPFFGPIIPPESSVCPAGWGMLIDVVNRIIMLLITLAIVFVAPLMIAYAGFLYVVNPFDPSGISKAKGILTNTIVGIVVALSAWMIVDALMAVLYNPGTAFGTWSSLITSKGSDACLSQAGSAAGDKLKQAAAPTGVTVVPGGAGACSLLPLTPLTDPVALQMEAGQSVIWTNTDPQLKPCVDKFLGKIGGGTVTSAYRPQAYQSHLYEIHDLWCNKGLQSNSDATCSSLKSTVSAEVTKHGLSACGAVAVMASTHSAGTGVDITGITHGSTEVLTAASQSCLTWPNYTSDPVHYNLKPSCTCN